MDYVKCFKALGDDNRLKIIEVLRQNGDSCACYLLEQLQISQSTLSHHMKVLTEAEIVKARKEGQWMHYVLDKNTLEKLNAFLLGVDK